MTEVTPGAVHLTFRTSDLPDPALACLISLGPCSDPKVAANVTAPLYKPRGILWTPEADGHLGFP